MFVRNNRPSAPKPEVGRVLELNGEDAQVEFWDSTNVSVPQRFLEPLPDGAAEALLWERPGELASWAEEAPLKLTAVALSVGGNSGKSADIREKLDGWVIEDGKWKNWWSKRTKPLGSLPEHFRVDKAKGGNEYTLLSAVDAVPRNWTPPPNPSPVELWKEWINSYQDEPPPGRYPPKAVANALADWPSETIQYALEKMLQGARVFLASERPAKPAAAGWMESVGRASLRWHECVGLFDRSYLAPQVTEILMPLSQTVGYSKSGEWLLLAGALSGQPEEWQQGFAAGVWTAVQESDNNARRNRRNLFRVVSDLLGHQNRAELAREIALAALRIDDSPRRYPDLDELDRILDDVTEGKGAQRIQEMIALTAPSGQDDKNKLLNYIANSRYSTGPDRLNLLVLATLLLTDGTGEFAIQASQELDTALTTSDTAAHALYHATHVRIEEEKVALRQLHEADMEQRQWEQERLRQQVESLDAQMKSGREESRLEIRWDMLLAVGDALQRAYLQGKNADDRLGNVIATLPNALREGGAETLGMVGDTVKYDPKLHHSPEAIPTGAKVRLAAPGVVVGERVILKASVSTETEVC